MISILQVPSDTHSTTEELTTPEHLHEEKMATYRRSEKSNFDLRGSDHAHSTTEDSAKSEDYQRKEKRQPTLKSAKTAGHQLY